MADSILDNRRSVRPRVDETALHKSVVVDETDHPIDIVKLDIVAGKITISIPDTVTVNLYGSIDGVSFYTIALAATDELITYGDAVTDHLVKLVKVVWEDGLGSVVIAGTQKNWGAQASTVFGYRARHTDRISISDSAILQESDYYSDRINISETVTPFLLGASKNISDTISVSETVTPLWLGGRISMSDNITVTQTATTGYLSHKSLAENPTILDGRLVLPYVIPNLSGSLSETPVVIETVTKGYLADRSLSDNIGVVESAIDEKVPYKNTVNTVAIHEIVTTDIETL